MIQDQGQHIIVCYSYGSYTAYACSVANAQALLESHEDTLATEVRVLNNLDRKVSYIISAERISNALKAVMNKQVNEASTSLRALLYGNGPRKGEEETRPVAVITPELKDEVALWCVKNRINPLDIKGIDADFLAKTYASLPASVFAGVLERANGKTLHFADSWALDMAEEYALLKRNSWKADAKEDRVVSRYLQFIVDHLVSSDVKYEVCPLRQSV